MFNYTTWVKLIYRHEDMKNMADSVGGEAARTASVRENCAS